MQYNRQLINLVFDIKKSLPEELKDEFKVSAPDLLDRVVDIFHNTEDDSTRELSRKFLQLAEESTSSRKLKKQLSLDVESGEKEKKSSKKAKSTIKEASKFMKIYRG